MLSAVVGNISPAGVECRGKIIHRVICVLIVRYQVTRAASQRANGIYHLLHCLYMFRVFYDYTDDWRH